jgi:transposase
LVQYLGIDWVTHRASCCAIDAYGALREDVISADHDGLWRLALMLGGGEVRGCIEVMSGAVWVLDRLATAGWDIRLADARKVKAIARLACNTDRVDARVLADLASRDLVPHGVGPVACGARLPRAAAAACALIRLRNSANNRTFGLLISGNCDAT